MDVLRAAACLIIIPAHAFPPFMFGFVYHVRDSEGLGPYSINIELLPTLAIVLFFFLAGWTSVGALARGGARSFVHGRTLRLIVPLIAWMLLFGPFVKYLERLDGRDLKIGGYVEHVLGDTSFWRFLGRYYTRMDHYTWSHLWFLVYLFVIVVASVPVLRWIGRGSRPAPDAIAPRWTAYLPILPLVAIELGWRSYWPYYPNLVTDWARVAFFAVFFLMGAAAFSRPALEARIRREAWILLAAGLVSWLAFTLIGREALTGRALFAAGTWLVAMGTFGAVARRRIEPGPRLRRLSEASLPVYILHHGFAVMIAFAVVRLPISTPAKIALIVAGVAAVTFPLYFLVLRRIHVARFLLGMPPIARPLARKRPHVQDRELERQLYQDETDSPVRLA